MKSSVKYLSISFAATVVILGTGTALADNFAQDEIVVGQLDNQFPLQGQEGKLKAYIEDMNGDEVPDVLVIDENERTMSVFVGNGDGSLQDPSFAEERIFKLPIADPEGIGTYDGEIAKDAKKCSKDTLGGVNILIRGNPGQSHSAALKCDDIVVASCTATIANGQNSAFCKDEGTIPDGKTLTCNLGARPTGSFIGGGCYW